MLSSRLVAIAILVVGTAHFVYAQTAADLHSGTNEFGVFAGYSPSSPSIIGVSPDRQFFTAHLQYARVIWDHGTVAMKYTLDAVPVALLWDPAQVVTLSNGSTLAIPNRRTYGTGVNPIGLQWNFRRGHSWQPFLNGHGGLLYFTEQVPVPESSQFNFTFSFGGGVQVFTGTRHAITLGYKLHHISNANTGIRNPGIDSNLFYAGWSFFK